LGSGMPGSWGGRTTCESEQPRGPRTWGGPVGFGSSSACLISATRARTWCWIRGSYRAVGGRECRGNGPTRAAKVGLVRGREWVWEPGGVGEAETWRAVLLLPALQVPQVRPAVVHGHRPRLLRRQGLRPPPQHLAQHAALQPRAGLGPARQPGWARAPKAAGPRWQQHAAAALVGDCGRRPLPRRARAIINDRRTRSDRSSSNSNFNSN
jgi:hypothetical protein